MRGKFQDAAAVCICISGSLSVCFKVGGAPVTMCSSQQRDSGFSINRTSTVSVYQSIYIYIDGGQLIIAHNGMNLQYTSIGVCDTQQQDSEPGGFKLEYTSIVDPPENLRMKIYNERM